MKNSETNYHKIGGHKNLWKNFTIQWGRW